MAPNYQSGGPADGGDDAVQALLRRGLDVLADTAALEACDEARLRARFEQAGFVEGSSAGFSAGWGEAVGRPGAPTIAEVVLRDGTAVVVSLNPLGEYHVGRMVRGDSVSAADHHRIAAAALRDTPLTHLTELVRATVRTEAFERWLEELLRRDPVLAAQVNGIRNQVRALTEGAGN